MGKMSKTKGASYELKIAKNFSSWSGESFYRTPASGAWSSQRLGQNAQSGDIVAPEEVIFPFSVELKHHEGVSLNNYMMDSGEVPSFFTQNVGDAVRSNKIPMLITHSNYSPNYLSLPLSNKMLSDFKDRNKNYMVTTVNFEDYLTSENIEMDIMIVTLEDFFEVYSLSDFRVGYKRMFSYWYKNMLPRLQERRTGNKNPDNELEKIIENLG